MTHSKSDYGFSGIHDVDQVLIIIFNFFKLFF